MARLSLDLTEGITEFSSRMALKMLFTQFGEVATCWVPPLDMRGKEPAHVKFQRPEAAAAAFDAITAGQLFLDGLQLGAVWRNTPAKTQDARDFAAKGSNLQSSRDLYIERSRGDRGGRYDRDDRDRYPDRGGYRDRDRYGDRGRYNDRDDRGRTSDRDDRGRYNGRDDRDHRQGGPSRGRRQGSRSQERRRSSSRKRSRSRKRKKSSSSSSSSSDDSASQGKTRPTAEEAVAKPAQAGVAVKPSQDGGDDGKPTGGGAADPICVDSD